MPQDRITEEQDSRGHRRKREEEAQTIAAKLRRKLVDNEQSYRQLKPGYIKGETDSTIVAAQYKLF